MTQKRYQYYGPNGIEWTEWFHYRYDSREKWQINKKLLCEYREIKD